MPGMSSESVRGLWIDNEGRLLVAGWARNGADQLEAVALRFCP
jgi:hypothetical protein